MVDFTDHSRHTIDPEELAAFTYKVYHELPVPYKYGETEEELMAFFKSEQDCPNYLCLARQDGVLLGWAGLYHWTDSMAYFLSWHPLVIPLDPAISQHLIRDCIKYTASSGRSRMEIFLMNLTPEYQEYASLCGTNYLAAGMKRGFEWKFMEVDLGQLAFDLPEAPGSFTFRSLSEVSNDTLWPSYDAAFKAGSDRRYAQQSAIQRRENFESFYSREVPYDPEASLVLYNDRTIVGFVKIDIVPEGAYVHGIAVVPEYRGQGLAKYILGTSLLNAVANQHEKMILEVDKDNQAALGLYHSRGFKTVKGSVSYIWEK